MSRTWAVYCWFKQDSRLVKAQIQRTDAIIQRQVQHILAFLAIHILNYLTLTAGLFTGPCTAYETPAFRLKGIQVQTLDGRRGHMVHPIVLERGPAQRYVFGICAETQIQACAVLSQIPQFLTAFAFVRGRKAGVA